MGYTLIQAVHTREIPIVMAVCSLLMAISIVFIPSQMLSAGSIGERGSPDDISGETLAGRICCFRLLCPALHTAFDSDD